MIQLPNLGVISTRQNDFSVDRGQGLIIPSAKKVHSFDRIINTNNNALINFIAHKYGMSYEDAHQTIQDFADEYAETLTNKGLSIPSVGDLSMDEDGKVIFNFLYGQCRKTPLLFLFFIIGPTPRKNERRMNIVHHE